jgi:predicted nucleic acid-binding protein
VILVDTSVWIDHLRSADPILVEHLLESRVLCHPFVIGELAVGVLRRRAELLDLLHALPSAPVAGHAEVLAFVEAHRLMGTGLGWIDVHLLASARLASHGLWTKDRPLTNAARRLGIAS